MKITAASNIKVDSGQSNASLTVPVLAESGGDPTARPPGPNYFNTVFSMGGARLLQADRAVYRTTAVGEAIGQIAEEWERTDAFGAGAMRFARYGNRTTAIGTLALQWLGDNDPGSHYHDFWIDGGNKPPSDPTWDAYGLETRNPAVSGVGGARQGILSSAYATSREDVDGCVAVGRNSQLHRVNGKFSTSVGYNSQAHVYTASYTATLGYGSGRDNLFGEGFTGIGAEAGLVHQQGNNDLFIGNGSGKEVVRGGNSVIAGGLAGRFLTDVNGVVLVGYAAGQGLGVTTMTNVFAVQNSATRAPLMLGDFSSGKIAVGKPLLADYTRATLSVVTNSGLIGSPNSSADDVIIQDNGDAGLTIFTPNTAIGQIAFMDPEGQRQGGVRYSHPLDRIYLYANAVNQFTLGASGYVSFPTLVSVAPAAGSGRIWYDPADGNRIKYVP